MTVPCDRCGIDLAPGDVMVITMRRALERLSTVFLLCPACTHTVGRALAPPRPSDGPPG